jgi:Fic family protein
VHFEAPPSKIVPAEMKAFIKWFNAIGTGGKSPLPAIARAGIAHLYFESIHPFGDGNGRIGRAISEKSLAQSLGTPALTSLAYAIERKRKDYYAALERNNKAKDGSRLEITDWLIYFARTVLEAQAITMRRIGFYLAKAKFYERFRDQLNPRQDKAIARLFREGIDGFKGGLSAENYISITGTSRATATRDLQDLVEKGALNRTGSLRHTRYWLAFLGDEQDG